MQGADATGAIAATSLGLIQRLVRQADGAPERNTERNPGQREARVSNGYRAGNRLLVPVDRLLSHGVQQSARRSLELRFRHRRQDCQELLAAPAHQRITSAQRGSESLAGVRQDVITCQVTMLIIDALE